MNAIREEGFNYAESTPMDNSTRTQGPSESVHGVSCCKPADRYSISDPGTSALNIFSIFYTHHRIPNKHKTTINFDTITNNYEVIYVIKTVMKYLH
jgi:hypothetical protein